MEFTFERQKPLHLETWMYRKEDPRQLTFDDFYLPFGGHLRRDNRWVILAGQIPWEEIEEAYGQLFSEDNGCPAKPARMALGALIIKERLGASDRETVEQIRENPYLQFFLGLKEYQDEPPFDHTMMTHFRKRFDEATLKGINERIVLGAMEAGGGETGVAKSDGRDKDNNESGPPNKGKLIVDATCTPADIAYPTDLSLLNEAREKSEEIIDAMHAPFIGRCKKPRTYRQKARRAYLAVAKQKTPHHRQIRKAIGQQLRYLRRNNYGRTDFEGVLPKAIPISGMIGDSHAAAFGEGCFSSGTAKATLGTGCSILLNTGSNRIEPTKGTVATICWSVPGRVDYALEGIIVTCGATVAWLRDQLGLFTGSAETQEMALSAADNGGVYLVPAFSGLGAPHWRMDLRAPILGLTFGSDKRHVARAALESIPYQIRDVVAVMEQDSRTQLRQLRVDGGITENRFVMCLLAHLLNLNVVSIGITDVSALGAAFLAGLHEDVFKDIHQLEQLSVGRQTYSLSCEQENVQRWYQEWKSAVKQLLSG